MNQPLLNFTLILLFGSVSLGVHAHGESQQGSDPGSVIKEQTAWGIAAAPELATRTIEVVMTDEMRFIPDTFVFREGETVRLAIRNAGEIMHELVIGNAASLREHAETMRRFPDMEHEEPYMAHVPPGEKGEIVWTFNRIGVFEFACLIPGHYQAGMRAEVTVQPPVGDAPAASQAQLN